VGMEEDATYLTMNHGLRYFLNINNLPRGWTHERVGVMLSAWLSSVTEELLARFCEVDCGPLLESFDLAGSGVEQINLWVRDNKNNRPVVWL
jgi:hypothetical protein